MVKSFIEYSRIPAHGCLPEPLLAFHPDRKEDRTTHPLGGLFSFGPYSRSLVNTILDPIRVASIVPQGDSRHINKLIEELEQRHQPRERRQYLPLFPGFSRVFGLRVVAEAKFELPSSLEKEIANSPKPHLVLSQRLTQAISALEAHRNEFDVLLIFLPIRWAEAFEGKPEDDFDLHDYLKAVTAMLGIPSQIIREDKAISYPCRASVFWRLGIALYSKAGGVPWRLADCDPYTAYIGISYALRPVSDRPRFVTCCSQVFDSDGAGLEFIAYETENIRLEPKKNPFLSRAEMRRVMARSLALYQRRHGGRVPKRIVVHKSTEFKTDEIQGCIDALNVADILELIQVKDDSMWRGVSIEQPHRPSLYPCERGSYLQLTGREVLLWTQGNAPNAVGGKNFFKEGKGIPSPIELIRFAGHGGFEETCLAVLGLTKMNWNNDSLYDRLPVTMAYAKILARTLKRIPNLAPRPYPFRFFM